MVKFDYDMCVESSRISQLIVITSTYLGNTLVPNSFPYIFFLMNTQVIS